MSDAKRYDVTEKYIGTGEYVGAMEESATGDWVAFSDYAPLKARLAEKQEAIGKAYFLLWTTQTHLKTVHKARRALLAAMTKDEQQEVMGRYEASCSPMMGDNSSPDWDSTTDSADAARCKTCGGSGYVAHVSMGGIEAGDCPRCNAP